MAGFCHSSTLSEHAGTANIWDWALMRTVSAVIEIKPPRADVPPAYDEAQVEEALGPSLL